MLTVSICSMLTEWAQKAHWKQGGLAGHSSKQSPEDPLPQPTKLAREFFYDERMKQLEMRPTREELVAMKPDLLRSWQALPLEERAKYEHLHQGKNSHMSSGWDV